MSYDRFCGGQLNVDSNEEESIPVYTEVTSQIIWLQVNSYMSGLLQTENLNDNLAGKLC
jgi:hypothetical protein